MEYNIGCDCTEPCNVQCGGCGEMRCCGETCHFCAKYINLHRTRGEKQCMGRNKHCLVQIIRPFEEYELKIFDDKINSWDNRARSLRQQIYFELEYKNVILNNAPYFCWSEPFRSLEIYKLKRNGTQPMSDDDIIGLVQQYLKFEWLVQCKRRHFDEELMYARRPQLIHDSERHRFMVKRAFFLQPIGDELPSVGQAKEWLKMNPSDVNL